MRILQTVAKKKKLIEDVDFYLDHNGKQVRIRAKKKRYIIGVGYPWYTNAHTDFGAMRQTSHGLGSIKLYEESVKWNPQSPEVVMLDPKGTHNGKKYKLILEEV